MRVSVKSRPSVYAATPWKPVFVEVWSRGREVRRGRWEFGKCPWQLTRKVAAWEAPCQNPACRAASRSASCLYPWRRWVRGILCDNRRPASIDPSSPGSDGYATARRSTPFSKRCLPCRRTGSSAASLNPPRRHNTVLPKRQYEGRLISFRYDA